MFTSLSRFDLPPILETDTEIETEESDVTSIFDESEELIALTSTSLRLSLQEEETRLEQLNYAEKMLDPSNQYQSKSPTLDNSDESRPSSTVSLESFCSSSDISVDPDVT